MPYLGRSGTLLAIGHYPQQLRNAMEVFAKNSNGWGATLLVDPAENGKYNWRILVEDRRCAPPSVRFIVSPVCFASVGESIDDGRAVLEVLTPDDLN